MYSSAGANFDTKFQQFIHESFTLSFICSSNNYLLNAFRGFSIMPVARDSVASKIVFCPYGEYNSEENGHGSLH